jgi:hypothetical protein
MIVPSGSRFEIAIPRALVTKAAVAAESIDQPTTLRLKTSSTTAQQTLPSRVGCSVMSVTQRRSGSSLLNRGSTRSDAVATLGMRRKRGRPPNAGNPGAMHEQLHGAMTNLQNVTERQLGVDPASAIGAAAVGVDAADEVR